MLVRLSPPLPSLPSPLHPAVVCRWTHWVLPWGTHWSGLVCHAGDLFPRVLHHTTQLPHCWRSCSQCELVMPMILPLHSVSPYPLFIFVSPALPCSLFFSCLLSSSLQRLHIPRHMAIPLQRGYTYRWWSTVDLIRRVIVLICVVAFPANDVSYMTGNLIYALQNETGFGIANSAYQYFHLLNAHIYLARYAYQPVT